LKIKKNFFSVEKEGRKARGPSSRGPEGKVELAAAKKEGISGIKQNLRRTARRCFRRSTRLKKEKNGTWAGTVST